MKLNKKFRSPNFNSRKNRRLLFIIIHYTAIENYKKAIAHLCNPENKVSCHFLISQNGNIYNLVDENKRAWHAGDSYWKKYIDINSLSLGIELDYSSNKENNTFSKKMINSLFVLLNKLKNKYSINSNNILGHSDIAPYRKIDPGPKFPWHKMHGYNLNLKSNLEESKINHLKKILEKNNIKSTKDKALFILSKIGYNTSRAKKEKKLLNKLILAYQSHYLQSNYTGKIDKKTMNCLLKHYSIIY